MSKYDAMLLVNSNEEQKINNRNKTVSQFSDIAETAVKAINDYYGQMAIDNSVACQSSNREILEKYEHAMSHNALAFYEDGEMVEVDSYGRQHIDPEKEKAGITPVRNLDDYKERVNKAISDNVDSYASMSKNRYYSNVFKNNMQSEKDKYKEKTDEYVTIRAQEINKEQQTAAIEALKSNTDGSVDIDELPYIRQQLGMDVSKRVSVSEDGSVSLKDNNGNTISLDEYESELLRLSFTGDDKYRADYMAMLEYYEILRSKGTADPESVTKTNALDVISSIHRNTFASILADPDNDQYMNPSELIDSVYPIVSEIEDAYTAITGHGMSETQRDAVKERINITISEENKRRSNAAYEAVNGENGLVRTFEASDHIMTPDEIKGSIPNGVYLSFNSNALETYKDFLDTSDAYYSWTDVIDYLAQGGSVKDNRFTELISIAQTKDSDMYSSFFVDDPETIGEPDYDFYGLSSIGMKMTSFQHIIDAQVNLGTATTRGGNRLGSLEIAEYNMVAAKYGDSLGDVETLRNKWYALNTSLKGIDEFTDMTMFEKNRNEAGFKEVLDIVDEILKDNEWFKAGVYSYDDEAQSNAVKSAIENAEAEVLAETSQEISTLTAKMAKYGGNKTEAEINRDIYNAIGKGISGYLAGEEYGNANITLSNYAIASGNATSIGEQWRTLNTVFADGITKYTDVDVLASHKDEYGYKEVFDEADSTLSSYEWFTEGKYSYGDEEKDNIVRGALDGAIAKAKTKVENKVGEIYADMMKYRGNKTEAQVANEFYSALGAGDVASYEKTKEWTSENIALKAWNDYSAHSEALSQMKYHYGDAWDEFSSEFDSETEKLVSKAETDTEALAIRARREVEKNTEAKKRVNDLTANQSADLAIYGYHTNSDKATIEANQSSLSAKIANAELDAKAEMALAAESTIRADEIVLAQLSFMNPHLIDDPRLEQYLSVYPEEVAVEKFRASIEAERDMAIPSLAYGKSSADEAISDSAYASTLYEEISGNVSAEFIPLATQTQRDCMASIVSFLAGEPDENFMAWATATGGSSSKESQEKALDYLMDTYKRASSYTGINRESDLFSEIHASDDYFGLKDRALANAQSLRISQINAQCGNVDIASDANAFNGFLEICSEYGIDVNTSDTALMYSMFSDVLMEAQKEYDALSDDEKMQYVSPEYYLADKIGNKMIDDINRFDSIFNWAVHQGIIDASSYNAATSITEKDYFDSMFSSNKVLSGIDAKSNVADYAVSMLLSGRSKSEVVASLAAYHDRGLIGDTDYKNAVQFLDSGKEVLEAVLKTYDLEGFNGLYDSLKAYSGNDDTVLASIVFGALRGLLPESGNILDENGHLIINGAENFDKAKEKVLSALQNVSDSNVNMIISRVLNSKNVNKKTGAVSYDHPLTKADAITVANYGFTTKSSAYSDAFTRMNDSASNSNLILLNIVGSNMGDSLTCLNLTAAALSACGYSMGAIDNTEESKNLANVKISEIIGDMSPAQHDLFMSCYAYGYMYVETMKKVESGEFGAFMQDSGTSVKYDSRKGTIVVEGKNGDKTLYLNTSCRNGKISTTISNNEDGSNGTDANAMSGSAINTVCNHLNMDFSNISGISYDEWEDAANKSTFGDFGNYKGYDYTLGYEQGKQNKHDSYLAYEYRDDVSVDKKGNLIMFGVNSDSLSNKEKSTLAQAAQINRMYGELGLDTPISIYITNYDGKQKILFYDKNSNASVDGKEISFNDLGKIISASKSDYWRSLAILNGGFINNTGASNGPNMNFVI